METSEDSILTSCHQPLHSESFDVGEFNSCLASFYPPCSVAACGNTLHQPSGCHQSSGLMTVKGMLLIGSQQFLLTVDWQRCALVKISPWVAGQTGRLCVDVLIALFGVNWKREERLQSLCEDNWSVCEVSYRVILQYANQSFIQIFKLRHYLLTHAFLWSGECIPCSFISSCSHRVMLKQKLDILWNILSLAWSLIKRSMPLWCLYSKYEARARRWLA